MSLDLEFFNRETNISAKVICDSISEAGIRITTLEVEYPRFIHGELMTHRTLSKNSSSSRAIPIKKMLDQIESNMAIPVYWGKAKSGMQADGELEQDACIASEMWWGSSFKEQQCFVNRLSNLGLHKQVPNRLTEPFQMMKVVITGTDWENFFNLRIHKDAQPEICMLAYKIHKAMEESKPTTLRHGEYHLPYVEISQDQYNIENTYYYTWFIDESESETNGYQYEQVLTLDEAIKISASCCAQVSYRNTDMSLEKADKIFNMLIKSDVLHASCFEHLATPIVSNYSTVAYSNRMSYDDSFNVPDCTTTWEKGITHMNRQGQLCSGNLRGFISYRHLLPNNTCHAFDFNERMELFK